MFPCHPRRPLSWQRWTQGGVIAGLLALLYVDVVRDLVDQWLNEPAHSHGLVVPPLSAYLAWNQRRHMWAYPVFPDCRGLIAVAVGCILFLAGNLGAEFFLTRISFVVQLAALIWTFWGLSRLRTLILPFLLLATMVPIPALVYNTLTDPLQLFTSAAATVIARNLGVSVHQDGNIINLAGISLEVGEACSGLYSSFALLMASLLLGYSEKNWSGRRRAGFVLLALPVSIMMNIARIAGTAILADANEKFARGFYHAFSGWVVFLLGFGYLLIIARTFNVVLPSHVPVKQCPDC